MDCLSMSIEKTGTRNKQNVGHLLKKNGQKAIK